MPNNDHNGRSRSAAARRRRSQDRGLLIFICILIVLALITSLWALSLWVARREQPADPPATTAPPQPPKDLELPGSVQLLELTLAAGEPFQAQWLVTGLEAVDITVSLEAPQTLTEGWQDVTLRFSNADATCTRTTRVYGFALNKTLTLDPDVSADTTPTLRDFITDETVEAQLTGVEGPLAPGEHALTILCGPARYEVSCLVVEHVPPQATAQRVTAQAGTLPDPATLVTDIIDDSAVTVTYQTIPELKIVGSMTVTVVLTDAFGNTTTIDSVIDVIPNENAPQFTGLGDISIETGGTVSYKSGVTATDPQDGKVSFKVDNSGVDTTRPGTYTAYYSATDSDGNTTIVPRKIIVKGVTQELVDEYVEKTLDKIIKPGMTRDEQIYAVYYYTRHKVLYVGSSDKSSIQAAAYEGFSTGLGDCYTYYAMNRLMLDALGIENLEVTRIGGTSHHWWNLVLHEDGRYYHVDSCPTAVSVEGVDHSKMTEADLVVYTNDPGVVDRRPNFYVYDKTLPEYVGLDIAP